MPLSATHCQLLHLLLVFILCKTLILIVLAVSNQLLPIVGNMQSKFSFCQSFRFKISMKILILLTTHLEEYLTPKRDKILLLMLHTESGAVGGAQGGRDAWLTHSSSTALR